MSEPTFASKLGMPEYEFRLIIGRTKVDYDIVKDDANRAKHKYSLESAVHFLQRRLLPIPQPPYMVSDAFQENNEVRHMHMTLGDEGEIVFFVTTMREDETVRVISLRKANSKEAQIFAEQTELS